MNEYFDLTAPENNIEDLTINEVDIFNCNLINQSNGEVYKGFVLAKSPQGNRYTICDVDFQKSATDNKFQPRLTFRRVSPDLTDANASSTARSIRMPFAHGDDGYRQFWKMIAFLYKFKETVDFGEFDGSYQVISIEQLKDYMNNAANKDDITKMADDLGVDVSELLRTKSTISLLKTYRAKLEEFMTNNASETDVQNWLDEDNHKYRQQRCMIFGLEYIDFKREGSVSSKRFDVLTRVGSKNVDHVLIELKSPSDDIFKTTQSTTNNGVTTEYQIHDHLSRAIPQILEYKSTLEAKDASDPDLEKLGIQGKATIAKCIIVIGKENPDARWLKNRSNLLRSLGSSLEIWTYTDLLNKLNSTIENLERIKEEEETHPEDDLSNLF